MILTKIEKLAEENGVSITALEKKTRFWKRNDPKLGSMFTICR